MKHINLSCMIGEKSIETKYYDIIDNGPGEGNYVGDIFKRMTDIKIISFQKKETNRTICEKLIKETNVKNQIEFYG